MTVTNTATHGTVGGGGNRIPVRPIHIGEFGGGGRLQNTATLVDERRVPVQECERCRSVVAPVMPNRRGEPAC